MSSYYPAYLNLEGRQCVVIGAGIIAQRKVEQLLEANASITLVSPEATDELVALASAGKIRWVERKYARGDLAGAFLAIAATDDTRTNREIHHEAEIEKTLLNVVDVTELCDFIAPSVVKRGAVTIAISTAGSSPALARKIRELMEATGQPHPGKANRARCCLSWAEASGVLGDVRAELRNQGIRATPEAWQQALDDSLLGLVMEGRSEEAKERLTKTLSPVGEDRE